MRTIEKQRIYKDFMSGLSILSIYQLANLYRKKEQMRCVAESEIEQAIRDVINMEKKK